MGATSAGEAVLAPLGAAPDQRATRRGDRPRPSAHRTWWRHPAPCGPDQPWLGRPPPAPPAIRPVAGCAPRSATPLPATSGPASRIMWAEISALSDGRSEVLIAIRRA